MKKILVVLACLAIIGCETPPKTYVLEKDDVPIAMQQNGVDGYWISKARMMALFEIAERYENLVKNGATVEKKGKK